ncbi:MAG: DUF488 family protein [Candidatus Saccharibacteria bacterium]|nr:DUF488 family protein [Candidatus Saccharibacteria bacterium]
MSRHTYLDGKTPDPQIIEGESYDTHWPILAPPASLVGRWHRGELGDHSARNFESEFAPIYNEYLAQKQPAFALKSLGERALQQDVTVLCYEDNPRPGELLLCHRRLLIAQCANVTAGLQYEIR